MTATWDDVDARLKSLEGALRLRLGKGRDSGGDPPWEPGEGNPLRLRWHRGGAWDPDRRSLTSDG